MNVILLPIIFLFVFLPSSGLIYSLGSSPINSIEYDDDQGFVELSNSIPNFGSRSRAQFDFTIIIGNDTHITNGGDPTGYYIEVKNIGTTQDTISLTYKIINLTGGEEPDLREWNIHLDRETVTLNPNEAVVVVLTVETGCGCQDGTTATTRVTGQSTNEPSKTAYVDTFTTRGPNLGLQLVKIDLQYDSVFSSLTAGLSFTFRLVVYNFQSVDQSYYIFDTARPSGWPLQYDGGPFEVDQNSKSFIPIHTRIPDENEPGDYIFRFQVKSNNDPTLSNSTKVHLVLLPELAVDKLRFSEAPLVVNEPATLEVTLSNLGQAVARNFVLNLFEGTQLKPELLINSTKVSELYGNRSVTVNFDIVPTSIGKQNYTVYVNPNNALREFSNRYGNNIKTREVLVEEANINGPSKDGDDGSSSGISNIYWVAIFVIIVVVLVIVFIIKQKLSVSKSIGRTAQKLPLSRGARSRSSKKGKKARKEKLRPSERARMKAREDRKRRKK